MLMLNANSAGAVHGRICIVVIVQGRRIEQIPLYTSTPIDIASTFVEVFTVLRKQPRRAKKPHVQTSDP